MGATGRRSAGRDDRGVISLLGGAIALAIGIAVGVATFYGADAWRKHQAQKNSATSFSLMSASANRNGAGEVQIVTLYSAAFPDGVADGSATVTCVAKQDLGDRILTLSGEGQQKVVPGGSVSGGLVIAPGPSKKDIKGAFTVTCTMVRPGAANPSTTAGFVVAVPEAEQPQAPAVGLAAVIGKYTVTFETVVGNATECQIAPRRTMTVSAAIDSAEAKPRVHVELSGDPDLFPAISSVDADLTRSGQYSGELSVVPGYPHWFGLMTGQFGPNSTPPKLTGRFKVSQYSCEYTFSGEKS